MPYFFDDGSAVIDRVASVLERRIAGVVIQRAVPHLDRTIGDLHHAIGKEGGVGVDT